MKTSGSFKKGDPRINRNGRPKNKNSITHLIRRLGEMADVRVKNGENITRNQALVEMLYSKAIGGNLQAAEYLCDRMEGKPAQSMNINADAVDNVAEAIHQWRTGESGDEENGDTEETESETD